MLQLLKDKGYKQASLSVHKANYAVAMYLKSGRYSGTYARTDIAFEFASWISLEFKLYIIKDYQRLKKDEVNRLAIGMLRGNFQK